MIPCKTTMELTLSALSSVPGATEVTAEPSQKGHLLGLAHLRLFTTHTAQIMSLKQQKQTNKKLIIALIYATSVFFCFKNNTGV